MKNQAQYTNYVSDHLSYRFWNQSDRSNFSQSLSDGLTLFRTMILLISDWCFLIRADADDLVRCLGHTLIRKTHNRLFVHITLSFHLPQCIHVAIEPKEKQRSPSGEHASRHSIVHHQCIDQMGPCWIGEYRKIKLDPEREKYWIHFLIKKKSNIN